MTRTTNTRYTRGPLAAAALLALAVAALLAFALPQSETKATTNDSPYVVPEVVDRNPDPDVVETTLVADEANVDIGNGQIAHALTYNGSIPGPTFRLKVGDTVIVHLDNRMSKSTAIHWHGLELSNSMDGTPFTQNQVEPGEKFLYKFKIVRPGVYWYHPHHHSSTNHVLKGLYGMIVVDDPDEDSLRAAGALPPKANTKPLVLSDLLVCKAPGQNPVANYPTNLPHVSGAQLPEQPAPGPKELCETAPIDEDGDPQAQGFSAGDIPNIQTKATSGRTNEGNIVLTNGQNVGARAGTPQNPGALAPNASTLPVLAGQGLRLQMVNAATVRYFRLLLTTETGQKVPLVRVGGEGGLLSKAIVEGNQSTPVPAGQFDNGYTFGEQIMGPGSRTDVVAAIPPNATGALTLWTQDFDRTGQGFSNTPTVPVMHLRVTGKQETPYFIFPGKSLREATGHPVEFLGNATGSLLNPASFTPAKPGLASQNVRLMAGSGRLEVDEVLGTHDVEGDFSEAPHLGSTRYAKPGDVLDLTTENVTDARHPFHLHGFSFQPISLTRPGFPTFTFPYAEFRDTIDIPKRYKLRFRVRLEDRPLPDGQTPGGILGRWLIHCHIFFHATNGMLSELVVVPPNGNERPEVNVVEPEVTVKQGETAVVKGTFSDRENNPVSLTPSIGSVVKDGAGTWTWTYPTGSDDSRLAFVTATDSQGSKAQVPFRVNVANAAPSVSAPGSQSVAAGSALSFRVTANDPDAIDKVTLKAAGLPSGLSFSVDGRSGVVSGTPGVAPGTYPVTFTATDGKHEPVSAATAITVTAPPAPAPSAAPPAAGGASPVVPVAPRTAPRKAPSPQVIAVPFNAFTKGSAKPTARARTFLRKLVKQLAGAKQVVVVGFPDRAPATKAGLKLAKKRATAAAAVLRKAGVRATLRVSAARKPAGRKLTIRVER